VYYGNQGWAMSDVRNMETWQGKKDAVVTLFTDWCSSTHELSNLFGQQLPNIWSNANVPMITWQPTLCSGTPNNIDAQAAAGAYDSYLKSWASRLKTFLSGPDGVFGTADDRRAYIRLGHEMNGNWYPWSAAGTANTPADYIAMWKHVKGIFDAQGLDASHVQWIWCVNDTDNGGFTAEQYYPGDTYVNWVAIDGYNWGTSQSWSSWQTASQVFAPMLSRLRALTAKPVAITETASSTATASGVSIPAKSQWISDFFSYLAANNIEMVSWFNTDKETDWAVFGGVNGDGTYMAGHTTYRTYAAYKAAVGASNLLPSTPGTPRLITDAQFSGQ
jgi:beta-mannanase